MLNINKYIVKECSKFYNNNNNNNDNNNISNINRDNEINKVNEVNQIYIYIYTIRKERKTKDAINNRTTQ